VSEDAFPRTNTVTSWNNKLYGYPPTIAGQVSFLAGLAKIVESVPNQLCIGVFYWSSEYQAVNGVNEAGFNTTSFFYKDGNVLPVADAIGGLGAPLLLRSRLLGTSLQLQWPFSGAASTLMVSTNLMSPLTWLPVTNAVQIQTTGALFTVTVPAWSNPAFYRLQ